MRNGQVEAYYQSHYKGLNVSVDDYNKTTCSTTCSLQHTLEFDYVKDPDSPVWRQGDDLQGSKKEISISIKRKGSTIWKIAVERSLCYVVKGTTLLSTSLTIINFLRHACKTRILWRIVPLRIGEETFDSKKTFEHRRLPFAIERPIWKPC